MADKICIFLALTPSPLELHTVVFRDTCSSFLDTTHTLTLFFGINDDLFSDGETFLPRRALRVEFHRM